MKKILCTLLAALTVFSFTGCKVESTADSDADMLVVEDASTEFTPGEIDGNVYTNEFAGITFNPPGDWTYATKEELAKLMNVALDVVAGDNDYVQQLTKLTTIYCMLARSGRGSDNVQFYFENTALSNNRMSAEEYAAVVCANLDAVYTNAGSSGGISEISTIDICGQEYYYFVVSYEANGMAFDQLYACRRYDDYMANIVVTTYDVGSASEYLKYFE